MKAILLMLLSFHVHASEIDVDWPTSDPKAHTHTLVITVDGCETKFIVKTKDLERLDKNDEALDLSLLIAKKHAATGCKK